MSKKVLDGWHIACGRSVYVENGFVLRGLSVDRQTAVYPYIWDKQSNCWTSNCFMSLDTFRRKFKDGSAGLF